MVSARLIETEVGLLEVATKGNPAGPPVVLLHHGFGTWRSLLDLGLAILRLAPKTRVIAYSRPGCGQSPARSLVKERDYLTIEAEHVLPALLDALAVRSCHLVGHSDGGSIALLAAALHPSRVMTVTAIAPHVFMEPETRAGVAALAAADTAPDFRSKLRRMHADPAIAYDTWRDLWLSEKMQNWDITAELPRITAPVHLVQGLRDGFGTLAQLDAIKTGVSGRVTRHEIPGADHFPHKTHLEEIISGMGRLYGKDP